MRIDPRIVFTEQRQLALEFGFHRIHFFELGCDRRRFNPERGIVPQKRDNLGFVFLDAGEQFSRRFGPGPKHKFIASKVSRAP